MYRVAILAIVLPLLLVGAASGQMWVDDMALGIALGVMQPSGGDQSYEAMGLTFGLRMEKPVTENVSVMLDYHHGETESGDPPTAPVGRFFTWGESDYLKTNWNYIGLKAIYDFSSDADFVPYVSFGLGMTMWEVQDWTAGASSPGVVPDGYDSDGQKSKLSGTNLTASLGAGVEYFLSEKMSLDIGGNYGFLLQQDVDNVGFSAALASPDYVDANSAVFEGSVALMFHFGAGDCDEDGIFGSQDKCPREKEDYDGFEDEDGCPDPDNDGDGILDADDACPDDAEDFDEFEDEDGCPDVDRDGDGIMDMDDACPDDPEDLDGFEDADGCPDPDNDGDGVLDANDQCPDTPAGTIVDAVGCKKPEPKPELVAVMVNFDFDRDVLKPDMMARLDALLVLLAEDGTITVNIGGHSSAEGTDEYNEALSLRRAVAVRDYLAEKGVDATRMTVVGHGEQDPLVPNDSEANRQANRRAMVTPSYQE